MPINQQCQPAPINSRLNVVVRSPAPFGLGRNGCWPSRGSQLPRALLHRNSSTHRFPRFLPRNSCFLDKLAVFPLDLAATDTAFFLVLISRIGRIENPPCSACGHPSQDTSAPIPRKGSGNNKMNNSDAALSLCHKRGH